MNISTQHKIREFSIFLYVEKCWGEEGWNNKNMFLLFPHPFQFRTLRREAQSNCKMTEKSIMSPVCWADESKCCAMQSGGWNLKQGMMGWYDSE